MQRRNSATPCPVVGPTQIKLRPRDSMLSVNEDTTIIDFTTEFHASLRAAKPRRSQTTARQTGASIAVFAIQEDEEAHYDSAQRQAAQKNAFTTAAGTSTLLQPAQRLGRRVSFVPEQMSKAQELAKPPDGMDFSIIDRRPGALAQQAADLGAGLNQQPQTQLVTRKILKPARRGTIYIPPDDTTMPSMYMGIFSPIKDLQPDKANGLQPTVDLTGIAAQMAKKRGPRQSLAGAPARRLPLQMPTQVLQESAAPSLPHGSGGGKENVPPGMKTLKIEPLAEQNRLFDLSRPNVSRRRSLMAENPRRKSIFIPSVSTVNEARPERRSLKEEQVIGPRFKHLPAGKDKPVWNSGARPKAKDPTPAIRFAPAPTVQRQEVLVERKDPVPSRFVIPKVHTEPVLDQTYPLLIEDLSNPAMYEENWLTHQEVAITQLVSNLFSASRNFEPIEDDTLLRIKYLEIYQDPSFALLHTRLQASLLYGSLRVPSETLSLEAPRLKNDLGMRSQFIDLWLHTYSLLTLRAALEVVVGRRCPSSSPKALADFITTFLICNEDAHLSAPTALSNCYHRTFLRSLLLVSLLDHAKTRTMLPARCLFRPSSSYKSSSSVIKALTQLLNPAVGDAIRALSQLDYHVTHVQYPLEEYDYHIANLAIDLRDGVKLTRLVELLLYPSASRLLTHEREGDATTTVIMPDGGTLSLATTQEVQEYPLSQHLKFPCLGRVTKLFNVQVALSALQGVRGMEVLVRDLRAEDIVDGYREKTVALLWALTGRWGLGGLLDWTDVRGEIKRVSRAIEDIAADEEWDEVEEDGWGEQSNFETYKTLLKRWAAAIARRKGMKVTNLTTSFADGKAFEAIVDEYEPYLDVPENGASPSQHRRTSRSLHGRLKALGCSVQFAQLFAPSTGPQQLLFDRTTNLAALAFLCSRLLAASRKPRAAVVLQRAWRSRWDRVVKGRKRVLKSLAEECKESLVRQEASRELQQRQGATSGKKLADGVRIGEGMKSDTLGAAAAAENEPGRDDLSDDGEGDLWLSL